MLKNKAAKFLKRITLVLASMAKAKTLALKSKTNALRTRLMIFSLLRDNKKILLSSISQKLHALVTQKEHDKKDEEEIEDQSNAIVLYNHSSMSLPNPSEAEVMENIIAENDAVQENGYCYGYGYEEEVEGEKFPDLTHSLFDSEDLEFEDPGGSVIDIVKNSKQEAGEEFSLEDEIDHVADLFIKRFHRQMRMQKQLSVKRHQEMLERSA
ncbi:hypothetical protein JCGZ_26908 [Jatropha curcas]|uniref:DUF761 domain-containing protein n=1 Tax=Jatropha curcas TaxID=180498 RepID=A0A067LBM0_JATCU|nr:uncharacterized protein LOC105630244 [Jatropha curcas]KDP41890.1 hypothetical protein JCGZ_26908 [Jatropha curcas]